MKQINLAKAWIIVFVAVILSVCLFSCTRDELARNESVPSIELRIDGRTIVYDQTNATRSTAGFSFVGTKTPTDQNYFNLVVDGGNKLLVYREGSTTGNCSTPTFTLTSDVAGVVNATFSGVINTGGNNLHAVTGEIKNVRVN